MTRPRALLLAESCNPDWPSLPIVGYKYARALGEVADIHLVTHVRNQPNIDRDGEFVGRITYIDTEWIARPLYKLATWLRGGDEVAWSTSQMMAYLPYLAFERQALKAFRRDLDAPAFDIVHRITPMSPTMPSYISGRVRQPFVVGPLNGGLPWPKAFAGEQKREKESLRKLRTLYRYLPFARSTYRHADAILSSFAHTAADLDAADPAKTISVPEIGFDPELFHDAGRKTPFSGGGPFRFLFAGRLVPYKVAEVAVRAFATSDTLAPHKLDIMGDGPERDRLEAIVTEANAGDRIQFLGRKSQAEVAEAMRSADAFVFPSIRELGAGVVIEAMAAGTVLIVSNYGAPGDLAAAGRGYRVEMGTLDDLVSGCRDAMERCVTNPDEAAEAARQGRDYAMQNFTWDAKAAFTLRLYDQLLSGEGLVGLDDYA
jgi:glycosyltransferase involved in cell wall biosynthesis